MEKLIRKLCLRCTVVRIFATDVAAGNDAVDLEMTKWLVRNVSVVPLDNLAKLSAAVFSGTFL